MTVAKAKFSKSDLIYDEILEFPRLASHGQNDFCRDFFSLSWMKVGGSVERSACRGCICPISKLTEVKMRNHLSSLTLLKFKVIP